jgi:hypothetical protein
MGAKTANNEYLFHLQKWAQLPVVTMVATQQHKHSSDIGLLVTETRPGVYSKLTAFFYHPNSDAREVSVRDTMLSVALRNPADSQSVSAHCIALLD